MNHTPLKGQRWLWDYDKRNITSLCIVEVTKVDSYWVNFKYVQVIRTNWYEEIDKTFVLPIHYLNKNAEGIFTYLEGQDKPQ